MTTTSVQDVATDLFDVRQMTVGVLQNAEDEE